MIRVLYLLIIYAANVITCHYFRALKHSVMSGVEFSLTGGFLAGYWYGWQIGFIVGCIFMLTSYLVALQMFPSVMYLVPLCGLLGIWGAGAASMGVGVFNGAMIGVVGYCLLSNTGLFLIFGERDFVMMLSYFLGAVLVNWIFFEAFF